MADWMISLNGRLLRSEDALAALKQNRLGSKSTASIFLMALHHLLLISNSNGLKSLLEMYQQSPDPTEFSRKLCYRMLSNDRPDKLNVLLLDIIHYSKPSMDPKTNSNEASVDYKNGSASGDIEQSDNQLFLGLKVLRIMLLPTVDIRLRILRQHSFLPSFLFYICSNQQYPQQVLEQATKCLCDLFLVAESLDFRAYIVPKLMQPNHIHSTLSSTNSTFLHAIVSLFKTSYPTVLDHAIRALSYAYEYSDEQVIAVLDSYTIFDEMLIQLAINHGTIATWLQHLSSHLVSRIPMRLRKPYLTTLHQLRSRDDAAIQNLVIRSILVMESIGMRLGVEVLYRESVDARRQKQIHMRRTCEGCRETERNFGEFMMCAGCRKVRYCSKDCQTRDWKYHRMQCSFFRPRAGYRSRGTQTAVDSAVQVDMQRGSVYQDNFALNLHHSPGAEVSRETSYMTVVSRLHPLVREDTRRGVTAADDEEIERQQFSIDSIQSTPLQIRRSTRQRRNSETGQDERADINERGLEAEDEDNMIDRQPVDHDMQNAHSPHGFSNPEATTQTDISYEINRNWAVRFERDIGTQVSGVY